MRGLFWVRTKSGWLVRPAGWLGRGPDGLAGTDL